MTNDFSPDEQAQIDQALKRMNLKDRRLIPSKDVTRFRQAISDELKRSGTLNKETVDRFLKQLKSGEI